MDKSKKDLLGKMYVVIPHYNRPGEMVLQRFIAYISVDIYGK